MGNFFWKAVDWIQRRDKARYLVDHKTKLHATDFSIISNNCWGGIVYHDLGIAYQTPFVNMYMHADCFLAMLQDLPSYLKSPITFSHQSKYFNSPTNYPVGLLKDVEIHFIHYQNLEQAKKKWLERVQRVNYEKLLIVLSERDGCTTRHVQLFDLLPYKNKVCFVKEDYKLSKTKVISSYFWRWGVPSADVVSGTSYRLLNLVPYLNKLS